MSKFEQIVTNNFDIWSSAIKKKSSVGRGSSSKIELYGVKKLRELILDLAVRGLLVPQDPNDEPASELLKKIADEKAKLIKEGKIKKDKPLEPIKEEDIPFDIPDNWEWLRLGEIGYNLGQKTPDSNFTYIDVSSINKELGFIESPTILSSKEAPSRARKIVKKGTVIYSTVRPYLLNIAVISHNFEPEPIASTAFAIIHPFKLINALFIYYYLRSTIFIKYVESCQTGIAYPAINDKQFFSGLFPIPPLEEQKKIVAKVDELMTLCDTLEKEQSNSIENHKILVQVFLDALINSKDAESFDFAWKKIADNFDMIFTTEWSIDQLKQTILQLAVMGKLVKQDPNDEPASELLKKISAEKAKLIKDGKIKKEKPLEPIKKEDIPFDIPNTWALVRLEFIVEILGDGIHGTPIYDDNGDYFFINGNNLVEGEIIIKNDTKKVSFNEFKKYKKNLKENSVLVSINGTIGNVAFYNNEKVVLGKSACYFNLFNQINKLFIKNIINSMYFLNYAYTSSTGTTIKNVSLKTMRDFIIPLPPIEEQKRIVAKVDELMTLCDKIKEKISSAQEIQLKLADVVTTNSL